MRRVLPYSALVLSAQEAPITSRTRLRVLLDTVEGVEVLAVLVEIVEGVQKCSLSLTKQWGQFRDGNGQRSGGYGLGLGAVADELPRLTGDCRGALKRVGLEPICQVQVLWAQV